MRTLGWLKGLSAVALLGLAGTGCATNSDGSGATGMSRGGDSPAVAASGRQDGGADRVKLDKGMVRSTMAFPTGDRATSVVLLEATGPEQVRVGYPYTYSMKVTNLTDTPLHAVKIQNLGHTPATGSPSTRPAGADRLAVDTRTNEARTAAARTGGGEDRDAAAGPADPTLLWDVGELGPKQTKTREMTGTADAIGTINNCLAVGYTPTLCLAVRAVQPELRITKEGPSAVLICQDINYVYRVSNVGTGAVTGVRVEDPLPEGLATADGQRVFAANVGDIAAGQTKDVTAKLKATRVGQFNSRAVARSGDLTAQSPAVATAVREPALAVAVEGPEAQYVGQAVNYRVTVRNTSDVAAENAVVRLSAVGNSERVADRTLGTIPPGETRSFAVNVGPARAGNTTLTATAEATCARPAQANASVSVLTIPALRLECIDEPDPIAVGGTTTYKINVKNQGSGADNTIALKAVVPPELQFVSGTGASAVTAAGQNVTFGPLATLAPGAEANWTVVCKGVKAGDARFYIEMTSASLSRPVAETESTRVSTGDAQKDIQQGAPVVPQGGPGPAPAEQRPQGQQNNPA
ncbi:MAG TPA: CARDB domain-containing protein, partial [Humisphaera sp.]